MKSKEEIKEALKDLKNKKKIVELHLGDTGVYYGYIKALEWVLEE